MFVSCLREVKDWYGVKICAHTTIRREAFQYDKLALVAGKVDELG